MRSALRLAFVAAALSVSAVAAAPAYAADGSFNVEIADSGNCVAGKTPTVQYNDGNPTMQAGEVYVNNCAS